MRFLPLYVRLMMGSFLARFAAALLCACWAVSFAQAAAPLESSASTEDNVEAQLVAETRAIQPGETLLVGLHFKIRDGWHTYWRFAGDSGAPTTIDWKLPHGFFASDIIWPMPIQIPLGPLMDYGYEGEVLHLVSITAPSEIVPGRTIDLKASAEWLVCSDEICIPEWGDFSLRLPVATHGESVAPDPVWRDRMASAVSALPVAPPFEVGARVSGAALEIDLHNAKLASELKSGKIRDIVYFPYADGIIRHPAPQEVSASPEGVRLTAEASYLATSGRLPNPLAGLLVMTRADSVRQGYEISAGALTPLQGLEPMAAARDFRRGTAGIGLAAALAFAFLGGLILNLMPCVFPVLSMKALAFARHRSADSKALRRHGWAFTAGVILSFLALGLVLFGLRAGGAAIGWGFQLQSPIAVLLLAYLMFSIGLVLSGALTVRAGALAGVGDSLTHRPGLPGSFFTGVLATVVATPCTAPFMGAALGYAIIAPRFPSVLVFLALGMGLALPFLVLSYAPRALAWLPPPGQWMERLKEFLAFPMYGAAVWLVWVLSQQSGSNGVLAALSGFVLIALAAWLLRLSDKGRLLVIGRAGAVAALLSAGGLIVLAGGTDAAAPAPSIGRAEGEWSAYTPERLDAALSTGRPVFIDATAAWCLTCKVNELGALSSRRVLDAFRTNDVLLLRADWTNRDAAITELLSRHGRAGVPLYLYYAKNSSVAQILPQILTESIVLKSLEG